MTSGGAGPQGRRPRGLAPFLLVGLAVALVLAVAVSPFASSQPDGLTRVAIDEGFADAERPHALADGPAAGYEVRGVGAGGLGTGAAGALGVAATFAAAGAMALLLRRRGRRPTGP